MAVGGRKSLAEIRAERAVVGEVRISALKSRGAAALAESMMDDVMTVDAARQARAMTGLLGEALMEIELRFLDTCGRIQAGLYRWDL